MKNFTLILALISMSICANASSKTVNLVSAGTLSNFFQTYDDYTITGLTITGNMDASDFNLIKGLSSLTSLDISGVTINAVNLYGTNYPANEIPGSVFYNRTFFVSVSLPNSVTKIGMSAFTGCTNLVSVNIPTSLTVLGYGAFTNCANLNGITLPNGLTSIEEYAFFGCSKLSAINLPASLNNINYSAFTFCTSLTTVTLPNSITSIESELFSGCTSLNNIVIPNSVTIINQSAFSGCTALASITIPNSVKLFGPAVFAGCTALNSVVLPNQTQGLNGSTFKGCSNLTSVTLPASIGYLGDTEFQDCNKLDNVTLPTSITKIGNYVFNNCSSLKTIKIPDLVTSLGESAFTGCAGLQQVYIPSAVTSIGIGAFAGCTSLNKLWLNQSDPSKITMGVNVFFNTPTNTCTLFIPKGSKALYAVADQWKDFIHTSNTAHPIYFNQPAKNIIYDNIVEFDYIAYFKAFSSFDFNNAIGLFTDVSPNLNNSIKCTVDRANSLLKIVGVESNYRISIMDLNNKILISKQINNNESISLSQFAASVYLLKITGKETNFIQKFIKE